MKKAETTLDKKTILRLEHEIKQCTASMSKDKLEQYINCMIDSVLADPGNPILKTKATIVAQVWNGRYGSR